MDRWYRVNKKRRCAICNHADWCTYTESGSCCMRKQSDVPMKNGGWMHRTDSPVPYIAPVRQAIPDKPIDAQGTFSKWLDATSRAQVDGLAESLGVDTDALMSIGCAWSNVNAWAFPMRDANEKIIGIRLRNERGEKWAVKGSKAGLFIPQQFSGLNDGNLYLVEGPTDLAAALTIGLQAIGRAACLGQEEMILQYVRRNQIQRLVILSDLDDPGIRGAEKLQSLLSIASVIVLLPAKDVREFVNNGGRIEHIKSIVKDMVWTKPRANAA